MTKIIEIEGIGEKYAQKLEGIGIKTVEALLEKGATTKGRQEIADKAGIQDTLVLRWVNRADLDRIKGVGSEYADLLECCGVDTVPELARRNAQNLLEKMTTENAERKLVRKLPTLAQVETWITQAKELPRILTY